MNSNELNFHVDHKDIQKLGIQNQDQFSKLETSNSGVGMFFAPKCDGQHNAGNYSVLKGLYCTKNEVLHSGFL